MCDGAVVVGDLSALVLDMRAVLAVDLVGGEVPCAVQRNQPGQLLNGLTDIRSVPVNGAEPSSPSDIMKEACQREGRESRSNKATTIE